MCHVGLIQLYVQWLNSVVHYLTLDITEQCKEIRYTDAQQSVHTWIIFSQTGSGLQQAQ